MVMTAEAATAAAHEMRKLEEQARHDLEQVRRYWTGKQALPLVSPADSPRGIKGMARRARVNVIKIVIESITQSLIVSGIRTSDEREDEVAAAAWQVWQRNAMDSRQFGLVRATTAYGTGYGVSLPGAPIPVMRPVGPRQMTTQYGSDDVWPVRAFWRLGPRRFRLLDDEAVYEFATEMPDGESPLMMIAEPAPHGARDYDRPVCPVVRFKDAVDLDEEDEAEPGVNSLSLYEDECTIVAGQVAPLMDLQDQINLTSFSLKAAEWYLAFRQRWMVGKKLGASERVQAAASQLWTIDEDPDRVQLGEFSQTELRGFLDSRGESVKYAATLSQTPVHELIGELVNLSAEALAAAEIGRDRMVDERKTGQGESYEQALRLACSYEGLTLPVDAEVVYKDTSARAFGAVIDALGKMAQMLQVPPRALWEKIPGVTKQEIDAWEEQFDQGDSIARMNELLEGQAGGGAPGGGIILPPGVTG